MMQASPETISVRFSRKPEAMHDVLAAARSEDTEIKIVRIIEHRRMPPAEYKAFTNDLLAIRDWLENKGGWDKDDNRLVIKITCPGELTLYVDPSGAPYARYVGVEV